MKKVLIYFAIIVISWLTLHTIVLLFVGLHDTAEQADAIVIFGNKVETNGTPSKRLQSRLDQGATLYKKDLAPLIIVSGGFGKEGYDEADVMKAYLVERGIPEEVIIEDGDGITTYATAKNVKMIAEEHDIKSIIVVTQYHHILRARFAMKQFGFDPVHSSHARMVPEVRDFYSIPREIVGLYSYLFKKYE